MKIYVFLVILWLTELHCHKSSPNEHQPHQYALKEKFCWGFLDFKFPNASARNIALATGSYVPEKNNIWAIGVWNDKIFASVYRFGVGVASSFNYFSINSATKSPVLIPYPSFDSNYISEDPQHKTHTLPSNSSIICAGYFRIDKCDRIWILDAGFIDFFGQVRVFTPPALVLFDLQTNTLIRRYPIPAEFINSNTAFTNLDVDFVGDGCDNVFAYIVDMFRSVVVYSLKKNRSWRLVHNFLGSDPLAGNFHYDGLNFQWNFGILGITIGERHHDGSRRVYLKPFASTKTYFISSKILQNEKRIVLGNYYNDVHPLGDRSKNGQIFTMAYDEKTNVLFDTQFNRRRVGCWNTARPYRNSSFAIVYKTKKLFFPDDIRIDERRNLWVLSNDFPIFVYGSWKSNAKNIKIFKAKVDDVILGTVCQN